ncbi:polyketide synthase dehydratase domain-containing protein [Archangium violaceum]|uniref:polyketide synthase dehydratase domain-containing protein n=1 Tax=Archangium violaceum TaxID=83451 RepID=UPI00193B40FA|nr:polyketide synthase dehydratase domain-containing protein [Archangium violaceum]QRK13068.1 polyketide synthase dehydratase domain-containing protein [Archangium violaceum]
MQPDTSQYPLLEDVAEVFRGESAVAKRDVRLPAELDAETRPLSASMELEFLAEVGALVYPDRVLVGMRDVRWFLRAAEPSSSEARLVGRARREGDGEVSVFLSVEPVSTGSATGGAEEATEEPIPVCRAILHFEQNYGPAPWPQHQRMLAPRSENLQNGRQLYASVGGQGDRVPESLQVVSWARLCELGRIQGGLIHPRAMAKVLPASRIQVAPAALEGALHLVKWLWYSFSGEGSREMAISEATWFRMPRRDERLMCDARLSGASSGLASFDAHLLGQDGIPVLELRGIAMASLPSEDLAPTLPRLSWQSFVKSLTPR